MSASTAPAAPVVFSKGRKFRHVPVTTRLDARLVTRLSALARSSGMRRSDVVRAILVAGLEVIEKAKKGSE